MNEIRILRKLDHPNIVKLHEVYEIDDEVCLVLEYIKGERLFDVILKQKGLTEAKTAIVMKQLLCTMSYLQHQDILHRDLKPENIMFTRKQGDEFHITVIDFGLATHHSKRDIIKKGGTAGYVAPEILKNDPYDFKADLYSCGVVMFTW